MIEITSEMAGAIVALNFGPGDKVSPGDELVVMESMKMEMPVLSPASGTVSSVSVAEGDVVQAEQVLMTIA
ncbi:acetyl-CoA carboxylase biotin carboxyl carrier protein subunit [Sulfitobacter pacificus]|uniref:Biotinylated protein TB7.3 n=1 Tax=Sulfitobacter pacificus TaxID=1499314 RepID=A0ABQ5VQ63_9RHOB|nr:acetyl-CoA carboxylase biotin carboxyl carrier protein subunit [Sulfitobacter pacificus]GLQ29194.1 biotinylated protein TB7.3 [Sulfitobacter pacificus]